MLNIKTLSSGLAAAALVSSIGLAVAQPSNQPVDTTPNSPTMQNTTPGTGSSADMNTTPNSNLNSNTMNNPSSDSSTTTSGETLAEREARADRN